jgi:CheY-like chemotaxis protein
MSANKPKILVVDDDQAVVSFIAAKLGRDFDVTGTTDPRNAVVMARAEAPDVILCDINMPGMKGDEVALALAEDGETARIPLVYLTSLLKPSQTEELDGPFGGHIGVSKSASAAQLLAVIRQVLGINPPG